MARSQDPDSAGSQFYICLAPQPSLDGQYTVFGQVTEGMDVVKKIARRRRHRVRHHRDAASSGGDVDQARFQEAQTAYDAGDYRAAAEGLPPAAAGRAGRATARRTTWPATR